MVSEVLRFNKFKLSVSRDSFCTSIIVGSRVYSNGLATYYSLSHCVGSVVFSGWNQIIECAVAWVTIAREFESEYAFHPVGQF